MLDGSRFKPNPSPFNMTVCNKPVRSPMVEVDMSAPSNNPIHRTVLVVEDEHLLRTLTAEALRDASFGVLEAQHADEALDILRTQAVAIHALFTDVHMPGPMSGLTLAHEVRRSWPWINLLIASGQLIPGKHDLPDGSRFLPKPYELRSVLAHLTEMTCSPTP